MIARCQLLFVTYISATDKKNLNSRANCNDTKSKQKIQQTVFEILFRFSTVSGLTRDVLCSGCLTGAPHPFPSAPVLPQPTRTTPLLSLASRRPSKYWTKL
jgi:hypothetical protein